MRPTQGEDAGEDPRRGGQGVPPAWVSRIGRGQGDGRGRPDGGRVLRPLRFQAVPSGRGDRACGPRDRPAASGGARDLSGREWIEAFLSVISSRKHCRRLEDGCPLAALVSEVSRADEAVKASFEDDGSRSSAPAWRRTPRVRAPTPPRSVRWRPWRCASAGWRWRDRSGRGTRGTRSSRSCRRMAIELLCGGADRAVAARPRSKSKRTRDPRTRGVRRVGLWEGDPWTERTGGLWSRGWAWSRPLGWTWNRRGSRSARAEAGSGRSACLTRARFPTRIAAELKGFGLAQ